MAECIIQVSGSADDRQSFRWSQHQAVVWSDDSDDASLPTTPAASETADGQLGGEVDAVPPPPPSATAVVPAAAGGWLGGGSVHAATPVPWAARTAPESDILGLRLMEELATQAVGFPLQLHVANDCTCE